MSAGVRGAGTVLSEVQQIKEFKTLGGGFTPNTPAPSFARVNFCFCGGGERCYFISRRNGSFCKMGSTGVGDGVPKKRLF